MGREGQRHPDRLASRSSESPDRNQHRYQQQRRPQEGAVNLITEAGGGFESIDQVEQLYPASSSSSMSSSPPQNFDVGPVENQHYMPILDEQDLVDDDYDAERDDDEDSVSSVSPLSLRETNNHDYNSSPIIFDAITGYYRTQNNQLAAASSTKRSSNPSRVIRCHVCEKPMRTFYCAKCIQKGRFVTLDNQQHRAENSFSETMIEYGHNQRKQQILVTADNTPSIISSSIYETKLKEELLQIKLRALTRKTDALKSLLNEQKAKLDETKRLVEKTRQQVELDKRSHRAKESKIELIKRYIASRHSSVKKRRTAQANYLDELKQHASRRVYQLTHDVFPIEEINLLDQQNCSLVNMETSPLLTFSDGSHHQIDQLTAYSIVEPWIPGDGDYSAYSMWVADNKDQLQAPFDESPERSSAFRIGAALSFITQFVKNLAIYLDVILPAKTDVDMFNRELLNDAQFSYNVAKLNANVIYLCVSQGIDLSLLQSQRTLKNLLLLFNLNLCDLGRKPIIELDNCDDIAQKIECQLLNDLSLVREDFYDASKFVDDNNDDDDGVSDSEWEISDTITNPMELQMVEQSIQQNSYISRPLRLFSSFWSASGN